MNTVNFYDLMPKPKLVTDAEFNEALAEYEYNLEHNNGLFECDETQTDQVESKSFLKSIISKFF